jgi:hypothetical protein
MSIKTMITSVLLLSSLALPALAEDYANDAARPYARVEQQPVFGGGLASKPSLPNAAVGNAPGKEASNRVNAPTRTDAGAGLSPVQPFAGWNLYQPGHSIPAGG